MAKKRTEMPNDESKRRQDEMGALFKRAAKTREAERKAAEEQRIWAREQNHNTY